MIDKNMKNISPKTTNWSNFGIYKHVPANTEKVKSAGGVFVVLPNGKRVLARTEEDRRILRRSVNSLRKVEVKAEPKPVTFRVKLVKARIKTLDGRVINRVCKVVGTDGTKKVFVTKKAALAWVKKQK